MKICPLLITKRSDREFTPCLGAECAAYVTRSSVVTNTINYTTTNFVEWRCMIMHGGIWQEVTDERDTKIN